MEIENETYIQVSKSLVEALREKKISKEAYILYPLLLDRYKVTKFKDESNQKYIIFTQEEAGKVLQTKFRKTITDTFRELESLGLIKRVKSKVGQSIHVYLTIKETKKVQEEEFSWW